MNNKEWLENTARKLINKMDVVSRRSQLKLPFTSEDGIHDDYSFKPTQWTNGFWGGMLWLMYMLTEDEHYKNLAIGVEEKLDSAFMNFERLSHDVGFLWMPTAGLHYKLDNNEDSLRRLFYAANVLAGRFHTKGQFFLAWNKDPGYCSIIDCLMNIPLLYNLSEQTDDPRYRIMAMAHADTVLEQHIRDDGSVVHIVTHNPETGEALAHKAGQGYDENSAWSRGQAWAIYGFTMCYRFTKKPEYLATAVKAADFFINHKNLPEDFVPYWDFNIGEFTDYEWAYDPNRFEEEPRDASAAAAVASALLELKNYVADPAKAQQYRDAAVKMLTSLASPAYMAEKGENNYFLLKHSVASVPHNSSIDKPEAYADYYFLEALLKLKNDR